MFGHTEPFDEQYHCYSGAFADKPQLEGGDKILLPASAFRPTDKVSFAEMALLKILPWSGQLGKQYEKIQYLDGDVLPRRDMDCFFGLHSNTFNTGSASPLNSGWLLAIPDKELYDHMRTLALKRLQTRWDESMGWVAGGGA